MAHSSARTDTLRVKRYWFSWLKGRPPKVINAGDTVWIPPHEEHWHGATANNSMCHLAIQESHEGRVAEWLEKVSEDDYKLPAITAEKVFGSLF